MAILDYVLVCKQLYQFFEKMVIDEERIYTLTKYATTKGSLKKMSIDHNPLIASFNIEYEKRKNKCLRREIFNLKNHDFQLKFFEETNKGV